MFEERVLDEASNLTEPNRHDVLHGGPQTGKCDILRTSPSPPNAAAEDDRCGERQYQPN